MKKDGILAQVVEHLTFNQVVAGSSPAYLSRLSGHRSLAVTFFVIGGNIGGRGEMYSTDYGSSECTF